MRSNDWHEDEVSTYIAYSHPDIERPLAATRDWRSTSTIIGSRNSPYAGQSRASHHRHENIKVVGWRAEVRTSVRLKVSAEGSTRIFASFFCLEGRSKDRVDKVLVSESAAGCMCRGVPQQTMRTKRW